MKRKSEVIVGSVTLISLIILIIITINIKKSTLFSNTYKLNVFFKRIKGLEIGAPVHVYGVIAGEVKNISYQSGDYPVMVSLSIKKKIKIYRNAIIRVSVAGLIGETRIEIDAGTPDYYPLQDGDDINGSETMDFTQVIEMTPTIMQNISDTIKSIKDIFEDQRNRESISRSLQQIDSFTSKLDNMLSTDTYSIDRIVSKLDETMVNLNRLITKTEGIITEAKTNISQTGETLNSILTKIDNRSDEFLTQLDSVVKDTKSITEQIDTLLADNKNKLSNIFANFEETTKKVNKALEKIEEGEGTISLLLNDPTPFNDLKETLNRLKNLLGAEEKGQFETELKYYKKPSLEKKELK